MNVVIWFIETSVLSVVVSEALCFTVQCCWYFASVNGKQFFLLLALVSSHLLDWMIKN